MFVIMGDTSLAHSLTQTFGSQTTIILFASVCRRPIAKFSAATLAGEGDSKLDLCTDNL